MLIQQVPWLDTPREHKLKRTHHVLRRAIAFLTSSSLQGSWAREVSQTKHSPKERGLGELEEAHTPVSKRSHHLDQDHHHCHDHHEGDVKQGGRGRGGRDSSGKRRLWPSSCRHSQVIIVTILIVIVIVLMIILNRSDQLLINTGELGVESHLLAESRRGTGETTLAVIIFLAV